jgi:hypothetical protein
VTQAFDPDDFEWHDGNVVDLQLDGLAGRRQALRLTLDLFPSDDPQAVRKRYVCVGNGLSRFLASGDVSRLVKGNGSSAGNIDFARIDYTADTEILVLVMFGGMIEAEASTFEFTEVLS